MLRHPHVSERQIAFVYAGDIWVVHRSGGTAHRLSSPPGEELFPRFSPDGTRIAFSGRYDGNLDVFVVPSTGGEPFRVTHHPGVDRLIGWTPDGQRLLFASNRESGISAVTQFYLVSPEGGLPERLPVPYGAFGAISDDGRTLAYTTKNVEARTWKRYRGGLAPDIWLFDLETFESSNLTDHEANDYQPMWFGDTIYFLSDRGPAQRSNLWAVRKDGSQLRQVTSFEDIDIAYPSIGPSAIVFEAGGELHLMDLPSEEFRTVSVNVVTDRSTLRPRTERVGNRIESANISPTGQRALFEARGDLFSVPAEHGFVGALTRSSGSAERFPAWSPDGARIAYWSDESGEYELTVIAAAGSGQPERLSTLGPGYRYRLFWSPDSRKIAFIDHAQTIQLFDVESRERTIVDRGLWKLHGALRQFELSWSPDSRWIAYSRGLETLNSAVFLFDMQSGRSHQVTSGYYSDSGPVFDPDGKYLYYRSNRSLSPIYSDLDATWIYPNTTRIVAASLQRNTPSPLAPRNDEEKAQIGDSDEDRKQPDEDELESGEPAESADSPGEEERSENGKPPLQIDLEGFESRGVVLPMESGNYGSLRAVSGKLVFHRLPRSGSTQNDGALSLYDLKDRKETEIAAGINQFEVSADGKKLLVRSGNRWAVLNVAPNQKIEKTLPVDDMEATIDPRGEWSQIFQEVWRAYRDFFYDSKLHGLDWHAVGNQYRQLLEDAVTRWDVNFVIGELIGEVNASHTYVGGGDLETAAARRVGLLGVDWEVSQGAYRIARIVPTPEWELEARSPLREPGVDVREGEYVLAVNGIPLDVTTDPYAPFQGLAEKTVSLTVNSVPGLEGSREVLVQTLGSEARIRHLDWIERNRRRVEELSGGRIGYVYVPNTGISGQTELVRQFASQSRKEGLIVDERFNAGGQLPDRFIEQMQRRLVTLIYFRHGEVALHPAMTHYGPKAMLINGWAGSGGDAFPLFFKELQVGPLVGERTWGGLIGPAVGHSTIDGGFFTAPPGRIYTPSGEWFAEGRGVEPDIPVVDNPTDMARGGDPQLERAVQEVIRLLEENPVRIPPPPPFEERVPGRD